MFLLLLLLVWLAILVVVGVAVCDTLANPVDIFDPADPAVLLPREVVLVGVALRGAPDLLSTSDDSLIMLPPLPGPLSP